MNTLVANHEHEPRKETREIKHEGIETEFKYVLTDLALLGELTRDVEGVEITQLYLSQPDEPYSLRLRKTTDTQGVSHYEACVKSRGDVSQGGLSRLESTVSISQEIYQFYEASQPVQLHKYRYEPIPGMAVDLIDGLPDPRVEIEDMFYNRDAFELYSDIAQGLRDITYSPEGDNEALAYSLSGKEPSVEQQRSTESLINEILARRQFHPADKPLVVTLTGRSGSGKSTVTRELAAALSQSHSVSTLSTDNYHKGKTRIEKELGRPCTNWDDFSIYDTATMAFDIWDLSQGNPVASREFSFRSQEVELGEPVQPADIILVEGIAAHHEHLDTVRTIHFDLGTPLATCIGRDMARIRQDDRGNGGIGNHLDRLKYVLEVAEPTYQQQARTIHNPFSASTRP